ncbi:MAG: hypothetical protein VCE43_17845 [Myxococcota bacterium]
MDGFDGAVVRVGLLGVFIAASLCRTRWSALDRRFGALVGVLVAVGLLAYVGNARVHPRAGRIHIHHPDVYHYYIGAKYFAELGQAGLYEATVIADFEDDRRRFRPLMTIRDLRDSAREIPRKAVLKRRAEIAGRFSSVRWRDFKSDLAFFRSADPQRWHASVIQRDHGYNGTPLTTAVLGALANWSPGGTAAFLAAVVWFDLVLVLATGACIGVLLGGYAGLVFLFFWFANPLNDYDFTGGAFLRYNYFIAIALGIAFYRRGFLVASGVGFAAASLFRIFPVIFPFALLGYDVLHPARRQRLHRNRALYAVTAVTAGLLLGATSFVSTPEGTNPWLEQIEAVLSRNALQAPNGVSLRFPFLYRAEHNVSAVLAAATRGETLDWLAATNRTFEARRPYYYAALGALVLISVVFARRSADVEAFFLGIVAMFAVLIVSHYYFCLLALVPLMFREDRRVAELLAAGMVAVILTGWLPAVRETLDLRYVVVSLVVLVTLVAILALRLWNPRQDGAEPELFA